MGKLTSELMVKEYTRVAGSTDESSVCPPSSSAPVSPPTLPPPSSLESSVSLLRVSRLSARSATPSTPPNSPCHRGLASPETTIKNFVVAKHVPADKFLKHTRVVCLPGFTATVRDELEALLKVAGLEALKLVSFKKRPH
jgi:hypothetical protein